MKAAFIVGASMIAWDMLGHAAAWYCRVFSKASLWNNYSQYIWPRIMDPASYDAFWALWFAIALSLLTVSFVYGSR
jgi:hypothetical protein